MQQTSETIAVQAQGLRKTYGDVIAADGVDLSIPNNTIYALLGPNGAGKTTTINMLTTMIQPTSGSASICGEDVVQRADAVRRRVGVTFQESVVDEALSGRQVLDFHGKLYRMPRNQRRQKIDALLKMVELDEAADRIVRTYSGGMKRRLELARGLMTEPDVLFLDEPTLGLDPQNRANIWDYIRSLKAQNGMTMLMTTHYMDEAEHLADIVGIIDGGKIVAEGSPRTLIDAMGADSITITGSGAADAFVTCVEQQSYVEAVHRGEGVIQIGVDHGNKRLAEIVNLATTSNFSIEDISVTRPSLADVFLKYTGYQLRD